MYYLKVFLLFFTVLIELNTTLMAKICLNLYIVTKQSLKIYPSSPETTFFFALPLPTIFVVSIVLKYTYDNQMT